MANVLLHDDGDAKVARWGENGKPYTFRYGDDEGMRKAYRAAVAEGLLAGDTAGMDEVERSVAREMQGEIGIRKDAADSTIVAWWPSPEVAAELVKLGQGGSGALAAEDLHLTLLYLGDPDADGSKFDVQLVGAICKLFANRYWSPIAATVTGLGRFVGPEDTDIVVALIDSPDLANFRNCLRDELLYNDAVSYNSPLYNQTHGFIPHITLGYPPKGHASPPALTEILPIEVDNVTLAQGAGRVSFTFREVEPEGPTPDMSPMYAARFAVEKAGRVLSGKNLDYLDTAIGALQTVADQERARLVPAAATDEEEVALAKRAQFFKTLMTEDEQVDAAHGQMLEYVVTKASEEARYTLGPLYAPNRKDAHGEYVEPDVLQKAVWDFVQDRFDAGSNRLNLQHGDMGDLQVASMVEIMTWPYDTTITVTKTGEEPRELVMPAGTTYLGAIWDEDAWPLVKAGKLGGWSLGGKAVRVSSTGDLPSMGDATKAKAKAMAEHAYKDSGTGDCSTCSLSEDNGNHV